MEKIYFYRLIALIRAISTSNLPFTIAQIFDVHKVTGQLIRVGPLGHLPMCSGYMHDNFWEWQASNDKLMISYKNHPIDIETGAEYYMLKTMEYFDIKTEEEYILLFGYLQHNTDYFIPVAQWNMHEAGLCAVPASKEMVCQNIYLYAEFRRHMLLTRPVDTKVHRQLLQMPYSYQ